MGTCRSRVLTRKRTGARLFKVHEHVQWLAEGVQALCKPSEHETDPGYTQIQVLSLDWSTS